MKNLKSFLMFTTVLSISLTVSLGQASYAETVWLEEDDFRTQAQGDGDYEPANINLPQEEVSLQVGAAPVTVKTTTVKTTKTVDLPAVTEEGDFLLPTYVLPEARTAKQTKVTSVDETNPWRQTEKTTTTHTRKTFVRGSTVLPAAETAPQAPSSNTKEAQMLANIEKQYQQTTLLLENTSRRLAALEAGVENLSQRQPQVVQTIQQPMPQQMVPQQMGQQQMMSQQMMPQQMVQTIPSSGSISVVRQEETVRKEPLLLPLAPGRSTPAVAEDVDAEDKMKTPSAPARMEYVDYILSIIKRNMGKENEFSESDELVLRSIPKEMKISFLPDTSDLSDQAFKWIKVFAYNPMRSMANAVEIRMSGDNLDLQSRRFALIKGVLLSNGVSARQIRFVFTDRDPDTIILRDIILQENVEFITHTQKNGKTSQQIIEKW